MAAGLSPAVTVAIFAASIGLAINASDFILGNQIGKKDVSAERLAVSIIVPALVLITTAFFITGTGTGSTGA